MSKIVMLNITPPYGLRNSTGALRHNLACRRPARASLTVINFPRNIN
jgi:hypothetical protein